MPHTVRPLHVSGPSRIMLPGYILHALWFGLVVYIIDPQDRTDRSPGLEFARLLAPMWVWGLMFCALAVIVAVAWRSQRELLLRWALLAYGAVMTWWAFVYAAAVYLNPNASVGGPSWPLFVAAACAASERSIRNQGR